MAMNVAMVYSIDAYRPIAGECIVAILGFKGEQDFVAALSLQKS